jgi:hypothetical protein
VQGGRDVGDCFVGTVVREQQLREVEPQRHVVRRGVDGGPQAGDQGYLVTH